jgi:hypothetical protein
MLDYGRERQSIVQLMAAASIWRPNRPFLIRQPLYSSKTRIALAVVDTVSYSVVYPTVWYS